MLSLFRNPLLRLLGRLLWLPALALAILCGVVGGEAGLGLVQQIADIFFAVLVGMIAWTWAHAACARLWTHVRLLRFPQPFLCPCCLHFGSLRFACGACGREVEAFLVYTGGAYVNDCPHCRTDLFPRDGQNGSGVQAYCRRCHGCCERAVHHRRFVRVLAAPVPGDLRSLFREVPAVGEGNADGVGYAYGDDGRCLTYVLDLSDISRALHTFPPFHAAREVKAMWLDGESVTTLELGQAVDRFIREADLKEEQRKMLPIWVRQAALEPAAHHLLAGRRFGAVRYGMAAKDVVGARQSFPARSTAQESAERIASR